MTAARVRPGGPERGWDRLLLTAAKVAALVAFTRSSGRDSSRVCSITSRDSLPRAVHADVLVLALGIAVGSAVGFDVSMALGAFLAGLVVGRSEYSRACGVGGVAASGCLRRAVLRLGWNAIEPGALLQNPMLVAGTLGVVLVGKPVVAFAIMWAMAYPLPTSLSVAVASRRSVSSFMLSRVGRDLGLLTAEAGNVVVAAAILSIVANPILYRAIKPLDRWTLARPRVRRLVDRSRPTEPGEAPAPRMDSAHRAIVVGYGPTGRTSHACFATMASNPP